MTCNCPHAGHPSSVAHRYYRLRPPVQSGDDASRCNPIRPIHYFSVPCFFVPKARQEKETIYNSIPHTCMLPFSKDSDPAAIVWLRLRGVFLYRSFLWATVVIKVHFPILDAWNKTCNALGFKKSHLMMCSSRFVQNVSHRSHPLSNYFAKLVPLGVQQLVTIGQYPQKDNFAPYLSLKGAY